MFNDDLTGGINETDLDDIVLQLNNKIDSITTILNDVKMKFYDTKDFFKGDDAEKFQAAYKTYSDQYELLKDNLNTYINDLMNVKSMMGKIDNSAFVRLQEAQEGTAIDVQNKLDDNAAVTASRTWEADTSSQKPL